MSENLARSLGQVYRPRYVIAVRLIETRWFKRLNHVSIKSVLEVTQMFVTKEKEYPVQEAVRKAVGTTTNSSTIYKWWRDGVAGVHLEAGFLGNKLYTSVEAVQRFRNAIEAKKRQRKSAKPITR